MIIQNIKNDFTVKVYETHSRIALEKHDLDQFNQCQTQLLLLYSEGIKGKEIEFLAYRIIYLALLEIKCDLCDLLKTLNHNTKSIHEVKHALE